MDQSAFSNLDFTTLEKIKQVFLKSAGVLWVTRGGIIEPTCPEAALAFGFARTARTESGVRPIISLDISAKEFPLKYPTIEIIVRMLKSRFFHENLSCEHLDTEFALKDGVVSIPRILEMEDMDQEFAYLNQHETRSQEVFQQPEQPLRLSKRHTKHNNAYFTTDLQVRPLPEGYIGIEVIAFGLNECDLEDIQVDDYEVTSGQECSGKVYAVGAGVEEFCVGDRVACLGAGTSRSYYHDQASAFQKIPDNMSYELAAAIPVPVGMD
ncbi:Acyl transferase/acyl hydrolase/lysophospholipase [Penicillium macrosclerotiorum]|uniref:Acyl transferase/acyl hydrolase/lysophospholipase n=1 Tax=Penicillium macrosclerotiorum TaxID=303699 RepID=UPI002549A787|nr:Acyl transferase/acyl hydrolase/lysophospholipase [Penicillium macrosclerotiorum]KAJ5683538.1 Acyl transferase/acyl hydrolase/lysophospholipase [Penicillium macrosclerotiorum]